MGSGYLNTYIVLSLVGASLACLTVPFLDFKSFPESKPPPCYITVRSYKNYEVALFAADLASKSYQLLSVFSEEDANSKVPRFDAVVSFTLEAHDHSPVKSIRIRSRSRPYVTPEIKDLMIARDQLHRRFQQTRDSKD